MMQLMSRGLNWSVMERLISRMSRNLEKQKYTLHLEIDAIPLETYWSG